VEQANPQPARVRDGRWLVGIGVASAIRGAPVTNSGARVRLDSRGRVVVETDMTDIGTGSYTVIAQTAAEMMGVRLEHVSVRLGDSNFPRVLRLGRSVGRQQRDCGRLRGMLEAS
jgi:xanthine dehydrogenase YagR molybdenum-binding subunit